MSSRGRSATFAIRSGTSDRKAIEEVWDRGTYEKPRLGFRIEAGEKWIDGGANVGAFSRLVTEIGGSVVAFEPEPRNAVLVAVNAPAAIVRQAAITLTGGVRCLNVQPKPLQQRRHSLRFARRGSEIIEIETVSFAEAIAGADGCKLNIEGEEIEILTARPPLGSLRKLVFEWSFDVDNNCQTLRDVVAWLLTHFANVRTSRKIVGDTWKWYPPNCFVYAWGVLGANPLLPR